MKKPNEGDYIEHDAVWSESPVRGTVDLVLSAQFRYVGEDGYIHYCLFKEPYRILEAAS